MNACKKRLNDKLTRLKRCLADMGSALIAFSGGVDSAFLLKVAKDVLRENVLAVTATSSTYPLHEFSQAKKLAKKLNTEHLIVISEELESRQFRKNDKDRCYWCKKELFSKLLKIAKKHRMAYVLDGATFEDTKDYRPGMRAASELGVRSPLKELKFNKTEIRLLSKQLKLPTWDKPSFACLASRVPYGAKITSAELERIDKAESILRSFGLKQLRLRHHGAIARIEVNPEDISKLTEPKMRNKITARLKKLGYLYVTVDLEGYRTGSMNEALKMR